ncbi:MAG: DUF4855 domain-containing protein [Muribaculaceae bacterium]|nr:DUF4855 domain-containing protein [Muribaculaceae bacterium]
MKNKAIALALAFGIAASSVAVAKTEYNAYGVDTEVSDPVLIPTGGLPKRIAWTKENLTPYLIHDYADGHRDWFFDSFIFNETSWTVKLPGGGTETRVLTNAGGGQLPAVKEDWLAYVDHIFAPDHDLHALDDLIGEMKAELGEPGFKHKVILGFPTACKDGRGTPTECTWKKFDWGELNGVVMNFSTVRHRTVATNWIIDEIVERFAAENFENIELAGMYCPEETLWTVKEFIKSVNAHIHKLGLHSYWIPYWTNNDVYALEWKEYGFDIAYRQPNYMFYKKDGTLPEITQLIDCIEQSKVYGLGLELEFETIGTSMALNGIQPWMHRRLIDYIDKFEDYGVWDESGVAHYCGSYGFVDMAKSKDEVDHATIDRLADLVVKRRGIFSGIDEVELPGQSCPFVIAGVGELYIFDAPSAVVYTLSGVPVMRGEGRKACDPGLYIVTDGQGSAVKVAVR